MKTFELKRSIWLPCSVSDVFAFFADANNLSILTPDWLRFRVVTPMPIQMGVGQQIEYRLRLRGVPIGWTSVISLWEPPHVFVDEQVRGPYRRWIHEHRFEAEKGGTRASDFVQYVVWGGALVNRWMVEPDLARIFGFRADRLLDRFGSGETAEEASSHA